MSLSLPAGAQQCESIESEADLGCPGCSTTVSMSCDPEPGDCEGCKWIATAGIVCAGQDAQFWSGSEVIPCGDGFERRFGGCLGQLWGYVLCDCLNCPE